MKPVFRGAGEAARKLRLMLRQNVDGEEPAGDEMPEDCVAQIDAYDHERRFERNRGEGVQRHTMWVPVFVERRDDGDTGGKLRAGAPVEFRSDRGGRPVRLA